MTNINNNEFFIVISKTEANKYPLQHQREYFSRPVRVSRVPYAGQVPSDMEYVQDNARDGVIFPVMKRELKTIYQLSIREKKLAGIK